MPEVKKEETHQTVTTVFFSHGEVASILGRAALDDSQRRSGRPSYPQPSEPGRKVEIQITQETEGSPAYNVARWRARVVVTQDHLYVDVGGEEAASRGSQLAEKKP